MSTKTVRRGAIAALALAATIALAAPPAFGASEDPPAPTSTATPAPEAPAPEAPVTEAPVTEAPATDADEADKADTADKADKTETTEKAETADEPTDAAADAQPDIAVSISEISLEGPAIADIEVTVKNDSAKAMSKVVVSFTGPVGWQVAAVDNEIGRIKAGAQETATFQMRVPEKRDGFALRIFTATVDYRGGDGEGRVIVDRAVPTADPLANLAAAYNHVGITALSAPTAGDFDGYGNTFSAEQLEALGAGPGTQHEFLGATLTMPDVAPGTADNVATAGQAVKLSGEGQRVVFLGSGANYGATGSATVFYTDGTTSSGAIGFPNWSFQEADAHGAELAISTTGRNRPNGYGDAAYQYRMFVHSVPLDAGKTVDFVMLPSNSALHVFAMAIAP